MPLKAGRVPHYFEVLVRLVDDAGQHVAPGEFMSAAERYQLMEELDRWVVATTLRMVADSGQRLRSGEVRFAINLSGQSLGSDSFLEFAESAIQRSGVAPDLITFEITESVAVARMQQAQAFMHALKKLGCHFSLDDFGTGLSSFAYLKLFPVDTLKIDGSFIRDLPTNVVSQSVVAAIAEVARVMQLETVAEYVQDQLAVDLLRNLNISYAQGYFVGTTALLAQQISGIDEILASGAHRALSSSA
jgi:Amt family ammonium transporter